MDRELGCLLGLAVGDALGVTYEIFPLPIYFDLLQQISVMYQSYP
jgi:ADP-ribosylglycohydrolase